MEIEPTPSPNNESPSNVNSINNSKKQPDSLTLKYPMLLFLNHNLKKATNKHFSKQLLLKSKIILLLNLTDLFFTWLLAIKNSNYFIELNPVFIKLLSNYPLAIFIKLTILIVILLYIKIRATNASAKGLKRINITLNVILALYSTINIIHIFNLGFLFYANNFF